MWCINTTPVIKINPIEPSQKETKKNLEIEKHEDPSFKDFAFIVEKINDTPHRILNNVKF